MQRCELCNVKERATSGALVAPCNCYKKTEDAGRVHIDCLRKHIEFLRSESRSPDEAVKCPRCNSAYRVRTVERLVWDCAHVCSSGARHHAFDLVVVTITVLMTLSLFFVDQGAIRRESKGAQGFLYFLMFGCLALSVFTVRKVFQRWKSASSELVGAELI